MKRPTTFTLHNNGEDKLDLIMSDDLTGSATGFTFDRDQLYNLINTLTKTVDMQKSMDKLYDDIFGDNASCYHYPKLKQLVQLYGLELKRLEL